MTRPYQQCTRCILDTLDDEGMEFDKGGVCHHCRSYDELDRRFVFKGMDGERKLAALTEEIKTAGRGNEYDSIMGLSGGVDSTYVAYLAKKLGLRPLAVHFDNGWNSELSVKNIENIISKLGFDLHTYVINWDEFRDLQLSYLKASVVDIEAITDHAIFGSLYRLAAQHGIRHILSGNNVVTEGILPYHWTWNKSDHINIRAIHAKYGSVPLKTFPFMGLKTKWYYQKVKKVGTVEILNYVPYIKKDVKRLITEELGWRDYGGKHYESIFTRFYQGYILPTKFKIDKRKAHVSTLICSGQMTRAQALAEMKRPAYDPETYKTDREFVLKKFGFSEAEFEAIMALPVRSHREFAVEGPIYNYFPILRPLKPLGDLVKRALRPGSQTGTKAMAPKVKAVIGSKDA